MLDLGAIVGHWGYAAIFAAVVLGNLGLPVPEESVLALAGYAVWRGDLSLVAVLTVGVAGAVAGDNLGYWLGRRYGRALLARYGGWIGLTPARREALTVRVTRHGGVVVLVARFVAGLRFLAGPLAGATGLHQVTFVVANVLGALLFVPYAVGLGYAVGYGLGPSIERLGGRAEALGLLAAAGLIVGVLGLRITRAFLVRVQLADEAPARKRDEPGNPVERVPSSR
jgi:membrane protein DedA with SNARE-associated domain